MEDKKFLIETEKKLSEIYRGLANVPHSVNIQMALGYVRSDLDSIRSKLLRLEMEEKKNA
jgi:hypothetical protein